MAARLNLDCSIFRLAGCEIESLDGVSSDVLDVLRHSDFLDEEGYLQAYANLKAAGVDPALQDFKRKGFQGRDPGPFFEKKVISMWPERI